MALSQTPSFFHGWSVDFGVASLLPALLLVAGGLSLAPGPRPPVRRAIARLAVGLVPATIAAVALVPYATPKPTVIYTYTGPGRDPVMSFGEPYFLPWLPPSRYLLLILGTALAIAVIMTWWQSRTRPERALATGLTLASVAYPLTWVAAHTEALKAPYWLLNPPYPLLLTALPALLALALMRRSGRKQPT